MPETSKRSHTSLPIPFGVGWLRRFRRPRAALGEDTIAPLIDLFAAACLIDSEVSLEEADTVLDFLRVTFAEQDHGWMARRLQRAVQRARDLPTAASQIAPKIGSRERRRLLFELYVLLCNSHPSEIHNLRSVSRAFEATGFLESLPDFVDGWDVVKDWQGRDAPLERLIIGGDRSEVQLPAGESLEITVIRIDSELWVLNRGATSIRARGLLLRPAHWIRLGYGHDVRGEQRNFNQQELSFFLDSKRHGYGPPLFLSVDEGLLLADRSRGRGSIGSLRFAIHTRLEAFGGRQLLIDGEALDKGEQRDLDDDAIIEVRDCGQFSVREMRRRSLELGGHFELLPQQQRLTASNVDRRAELRLTTDLAPPFEIEIHYSHQLREGRVSHIEGAAKATLDGKSLVKGQTLKDGDLIRLSRRQAIRCRFSAGTLEEELNHITELRVEGLNHSFPDGNQALSHLDLDLKSGEMLAIIGPSGCGKSTLLEILGGHLVPTRGQVRYNGLSLYRWRKRLLPLIAQLPHEEALRSELTIREHLNHALIARVPSKSRRRRLRKTHLVLDALDLHHRADYRVGDPGEKILSAGERSRLNLGLDLTGNANVFLLDEPIAGLSSKDAEKIIDSLYQLSRERLVMATLHRPNSRILSYFDRLLVLDYGGHLAFCGPRHEAGEYFRQAAEDLGLGSLSHESGSDLIFEVLENAHLYEGAARRKNSTLWSDRFESHRLMQNIRTKAPARSQMGSRGHADDNLPIPARARHGPGTWFSLFSLQLQRDLIPRLRSKASLPVMIIQPLVLGWLISGILRYSQSAVFHFYDAPHIPAFLFLSSVVAMFFGLTNAATDLLRDAPTLRRERNTCPARSSYFAAKALGFALIGGLQCLLYLLASLPLLDFPLASFGLITPLLLTALAGSGLAMVSSLVIRTERAAMAAVPVLLVPQVLLAGALVPFDQMNHRFPALQQSPPPAKRPPPLAGLNPLRYGFESLVLHEAENNRFRRTEHKLQTFRDGRLANLGEAPLAKRALLKLHFLTAASRDEAAEKISALINAVRKKDSEGLAQVTQSTDPRARPLEHFFSNRQVNDSVTDAEIFRLSTKRKTPDPVFLGKQRRVFGIEFDTLAVNSAILVTFGLIFWWVSATFLRIKFDFAKR